MIAYFPDAYPDELLYSRLARYYTSEGYLAYSYAAEDLFISKTVRPDMEFVNTYTESAYNAITRNMPMEQVVQKHTMFPYYGWFLPLERRQKAFRALVDMTGNYFNLMPIPKSKTGKARYLRYCPLCAEYDREKYGETYWHRTHQMIGHNACHIHKCRVTDSSIIISGRSSPCLTTAEEMIPLSEDITLANEIECRLAEYMSAVFQSDTDMKSDVMVGDFLHSEMADTKYRSVRGEQRNIALLQSDFSRYYKDLTDNYFTEIWQIQKVLTNDRINFYEICLLAMFIGISVDRLVNMRLPEKSQQQLFDEEIYKLHEQGLKYPEIASKLNASYNTVKSIGERRYGTYHKPYKEPLKSGRKVKNWQQIDEDTLPLVKEAIKKLRGDGNSRPQKVSVFAVEKLLGLTSKTISLHLPKCLNEIRKYEETQERYWAREIVWAVRFVMRSESTIYWRRIRDLTNMRRRDFERCLPYVSEFADSALTEKIMNLRFLR